MLTAPGSDPQEEGPQRTGRSRRSPGCLDQHAARMAAALLGDPSVIGRPRPRLSDARVQAEIADELLRFVEARHLADRRHHGERHHHVDARDRHQPLDALVRQRRAGEVALDHLQVLAEPVELAQMPFDREPLVLRHDLIDEPGPAFRPAQIGVRAGRDQMAVQDRLDDVLQPRSLPNDLVAAGDLPAQRLGRLVRDPDLRQEAAGVELRQHAGVDRVGLDLRVRDDTHLLRVGDHHLLHVRG